MRGLPLSGVLIASGDGFGMKEFSTSELEAAVRYVVALEANPVLPLGRQKRRCLQPQLFVSFKLTRSRTIPSSFRKF